MPDIMLEPMPPSVFAPLPGGQTAFWNDLEHPVLFLEGGWGAGKTTVGAHKLLDIHLANAFDDRGQPTGVPSAMVGPTHGAFTDYMLPAMQEAARNFGVACEYREVGLVGDRPVRNVLFFPELSSRGAESLIICRTAERPSLITGWEVGAAWGDEPTRWREDYENPKNDPMIQLQGRVRHKRARVLVQIYTYTNEGDATRVYEMAHDGAASSAVYCASARDNPHVARMVALLEQRLTPEQRAQYIDGRAMNLRGQAAYRAFDPTPGVHIRPIPGLIRRQPLCLVFDFNIDPGMHVYVAQFDQTAGRIWVFDEIHGPSMSVDQAMAEFVRVYGKHIPQNFPSVRVYGDAAGRQRSTITGATHYASVYGPLTRAGIESEFWIPASNPPVVDRVNTLNAAFMPCPDGEPGIVIDPRCVRLIRDLKEQKWNRNGQLDSKNGAVGHGSDALGYLAYVVKPIRVESHREPGTFHTMG